MLTDPDSSDAIFSGLYNFDNVFINAKTDIGVFPNGQVIRVLQYNGEPMRWVRSLGFDAIITRDPPTAELLREAIQTRVLVYQGKHVRR